MVVAVAPVIAVLIAELVAEVVANRLRRASGELHCGRVGESSAMGTSMA